MQNHFKHYSLMNNKLIRPGPFQRNNEDNSYSQLYTNPLCSDCHIFRSLFPFAVHGLIYGRECCSAPYMPLCHGDADDCMEINFHQLRLANS
jgi:hypothetical protein